jgi:hypothetical protein
VNVDASWPNLLEKETRIEIKLASVSQKLSLQ